MRRGRAAISTTHKMKPTLERFVELCADFNFVKLIFNLIKSNNTTKKTTEKGFCVTANSSRPWEYNQDRNTALMMPCNLVKSSSW